MNAPDLPPRLPRRTLRVGITGHRDMPEADVTALTARVREVLLSVGDTVTATTDALGLDGARPPCLVLVSPLAAGADQLAAEVALDLGYELHVPTPFLVSEYEKDFAGDAAGRARFRDLLGRATRVFEAGSARDVSNPAAMPRAYLSAGRFVLSNCDLLLALWNGRPAKGVGGTAEIVAEALEAGIPVVVVPPERPEAADLRVCDAGRTTSVSSLDALPGVVRRALSPFGAAAPTPGAPRVAGHSQEDREVLATQRDHYQAFLDETHPTARSPARRWPAALVIAPWNAFLRWVGGARRRGSSGAPPAPAPFQGEGARAYSDRVDALAQYYMALYRGAFFVNYVLGATAVTLALLGLLPALFDAHGHPPGLLAVFELVAIGLIAFLFWQARIGRWHEKGVNYRVLAELLRQHRHLAPLGLAVPSTRPRAHVGGEADLTLTWMVAHFRAIAREAGLTSARFAGEHLAAARNALLTGWIRDQERYHERTGRVLGRAEHRLEAAALVLFGGAAVACIGHLIPSVAHAAGPWLSAVAAGLPAWAAAIHGILGRAELTRLAERSEAMVPRLRDIATRLEAIPAATLTLRELAESANATSLATLHELDDWQALSRAGDVPLP